MRIQDLEKQYLVPVVGDLTLSKARGPQTHIHLIFFQCFPLRMFKTLSDLLHLSMTFLDIIACLI